jgi:hypothetical protein
MVAENGIIWKIQESGKRKGEQWILVASAESIVAMMRK